MKAKLDFERCRLDLFYLDRSLFLPLLSVIFSFIVRRVILVNHACEAELLILDTFDLSQFVQVHLTQVEDHVILFDFPIETEAVRYLQECFEIVR